MLHVSSAPTPSGWVLRPIRVDGLPERIEVPPAGLALGRAPTNEVVLDPDLYPHVSGHHARLCVSDDGSLVLEDLNSRNGCLVNGRRDHRRVLRDGDFIQLGSAGPQFVVERITDGATATLAAVATAAPDTKDVSASTVFRVKKALGLPPDADITGMVERKGRQQRALVVAVGAGLAFAIAAVFYLSRETSQAQLERLNTELKGQLAERGAAFERQAAEFEAQKRFLEAERADLTMRLNRLTEADAASAAEMVRLQADLAKTTAALARYDPANLETAKLAEVKRVQDAVVFIETRLRFRNSKTKQMLRLSPKPHEDAAFADDGDYYERESTGSGFCVSPEGWIITNAHVVHPLGHDQSLELGDDEVLEPVLVIDVVFSGQRQRRPTALVKAVDEEHHDLALLKIEPFEGMPHLRSFSTDAPPIVPGAEVFIHGFPFGKVALQEGDRVIASTSKGILSRVVSAFLQVDAAVHPGNSGGPLTDARGNVLGIVTRVQRTPEGPLAPAIGYAIPIASAKRIWPPGQ
jgi:S1-C subfamily serine protease